MRRELTITRCLLGHATKRNPYTAHPVALICNAHTTNPSGSPLPAPALLQQHPSLSHHLQDLHHLNIAHASRSPPSAYTAALMAKRKKEETESSEYDGSSDPVQLSEVPNDDLATESEAMDESDGDAVSPISKTQQPLSHEGIRRAHRTAAQIRGAGSLAGELHDLESHDRLLMMLPPFRNGRHPHDPLLPLVLIIGGLSSLAKCKEATEILTTRDNAEHPRLVFQYVPLRCHPWAPYISTDRALRQYTKAVGITTCASEMLTSSVLLLSGLDTLVMYQDDRYEHTYH